MRVMVTAFEPFGGEKINPTMLLLEKLAAPDGIELEKVVLPVVFGEAEARAIDFLNAHPADAVVMLGQAGGRAAITVERVAINFDDASLPDNAGNQPREQSIRENAPAAYFSTLPVRRMVDRIQESGVRGAVSLGAKLFGHFDPRSASAEEALRHCKIPVLFLHGEDDRFVPCEMSRINCAACASEKTLVTFPGAGHALSFLIDEAKYTSATHDFLEKTNPIR